MRRVVVFDAYPFLMSGSQQTAGRVAAALTERGWSATVVLPAEGSTSASLRALGVDVRVVPAPRVLMRYGGAASRWQLLLSTLAAPLYWWRLFPVVRTADVVWLNDLRGTVLGLGAARLARRPVVWALLAAQPQLTSLIPLMARLSQVVVVPSRHATQGLAADRLSILPIPVPVPDEPWSDPGDDVPLIVTVGRLYRAKGFDVLLDACDVLRRSGRRFHVVIVGGESPGHENDAVVVRRRRAELHLDDVVEFRGFVDDLDALVRRATIYVQPSRAETFGLATQEALAMGMPVVATTAGGLRDRIDDGHNGLAVPTGDVQALAAAIARLLDDPQLRARLGATAWQSARAAISADAFGASVEALCTTAMQRKGRA